MAKTVLVVDDEDLVRMVIRQTLEKEGLTVMEATNGKEAVKMFKENPADLIITDIIMPEQEGVETIVELKREFPDLQIIAVSGGGRIGATDYLEIAKQFGAALTFEKPFNRDELLNAVIKCLESKAA